MTKTTILGLTGSIGSGKSSAAEIFRKYGAEIIDADVLARQVVEPGTPALAQIESEFGIEVLETDGSLNRKKLASLIFNDQKKLKRLEEITHPLIRQLFLQKLDEIKKIRNPALILAVIPLLFETSNRYPELEKIIVVTAPRDQCLSRIVKRDSCSVQMAKQRMNSQIAQEIKASKADLVIENNGTLEDLDKKVIKLLGKL